VVRDLNSPAAETMRGLRARIRFAAGSAPPKIVLFTSAVANEGKSSVSAAFARVAATDGLRTLLIEADLHNPSLARMLSLQPRAALVDGLAGRVDWGDCITVDPDTGLHLLLADEAFDKPQQVFESMQFQNLLTAATSAYDLVVIDSPPVMLVSDAILLSHFADSVLLIAESNRTRRRVVAEAVKRLAAASRGITGIVLSKTESVQVAGGFYGGYSKA
jgi:capsular exopolysaccharide synthesis family protein